MGTKLYVGNLNYNTTEQTLGEVFGADGRQVTDIAVMTDRMTGRPRGFAFVTMGSPEDAEAAIAALNGKTVDGRPLKVNEAQERAPRSGGGGGGGYGGDRGGGGGGYGGNRGGGDRGDRGGGYNRY
jgi:cold-inducible RNA-binding protein